MNNDTITYLSTKETAQIVRAELQKAFPHLSKKFFSVRSKSYAGGSSIDVYWTDGPAELAVTNILKKFEGAEFDGMIDLKSYKETVWDGKNVHFGADYVTGNRKTSEHFVRKVAEAFERYIGKQPMVETSHSHEEAWFSLQDPNVRDLRHILDACDERDLETLEISIVGGRFDIKRPGTMDDEESYRQSRIPKSGMLTKIGALRLGVPNLRGEMVEYEEYEHYNGEKFASAVKINGELIGQAASRLEFGENGVVITPLKSGVLTDKGATRMCVPILTNRKVWYVERMHEAQPFADDIYYRGERLGSTLSLVDGILPDDRPRQFLWAAESEQFEIIRSIKQMICPFWIDGIEVTVVDDRGIEQVHFDFSWYDFDGLHQMKLEIESKSFPYLALYEKLFAACTLQDPLPYDVVNVLKEYGFFRRET